MNPTHAAHPDAVATTVLTEVLNVLAQAIADPRQQETLQRHGHLAHHDVCVRLHPGITEHDIELVIALPWPAHAVAQHMLLRLMSESADPRQGKPWRYALESSSQAAFALLELRVVPPLEPACLRDECFDLVDAVLDDWSELCMLSGFGADEAPPPPRAAPPAFERV